MNNTAFDCQIIVLLSRIAQRDEKALRELYDLTSGKLFGLALRVVKSNDHAEDVIQEVYLNVWKIAGDYRASLSPPMAWLGVIVRSRSLDFLRRRASERADAGQELDEAITETVPGNALNPLEMAQLSEEAFALHQCMGKLDNKQREVIALAYLRDLSHGELAKQLELPLGTVKTWIRRGIDQLRICMARFA